MDIYELLNILNSNGTQFPLILKPGIDPIHLLEIENRFQIQLPSDLKIFYTSTNGLEGDDLIFNIIPIDQAEKQRDSVGEYINFAEYMIFSETCGLEINPHDNNKYKIFKVTSPDGFVKRHYIANSITDFIKLYCDKGTWGIWGDE